MPAATSDKQPTHPERSPRRLLAQIVLAAFAIRLVVVLCNYRDLPDADKFYESFGWEVGWVARAIASGRGFTSAFFQTTEPTAMVSPLYTYLLAGVFRLFGIYSLTSAFVILSINSLFSSLTCIPVYFSAHYSLGSRGAKLAAWAWAIYPFAIYFSAGRVWEYSLTSLLFTTCFCILQRIHTSSRWFDWLGFGLLYGITANSNPAVLSSLPFLLILALWKARKLGGRWLLYGVLTSVGVLAALTPWTVRNYRVLHVLCPIRDNYWSNVYTGNIQDNIPDRYPFFRANEPMSNPAEMQKFVAEGEIGFFAERHAQATDFIRHNLPSVGIASLRRLVMYWTGYWSLSRDYLREEPTEIPLMFMLICVTAFMLRGVHRFWRENRSAGLPYFILILAFPLSYYVTLALMDYRQPIEPAVVVLAIAGLIPFKKMQSDKWIGAERAKAKRIV
jgi:4-amino-4-deoxy-L-arabinose transferase-like glycosyltransferase